MAANRKRKFAACRLLQALLSTLLYLQRFLQGHDIHSESLEGRIRCIRNRLDDFADPGFTVLKTTVLYTFHDPEGEDEVDPVGELIAISDSSESESVVAAAPKLIRSDRDPRDLHHRRRFGLCRRRCHPRLHRIASCIIGDTSTGG